MSIRISLKLQTLKMPTNSQFAVATHILTIMASKEKPVTSRALSESVNTHPVVVRRIIGRLQDAGLVHTQMGVDGGTSLLRPADQITLLDVYRATGQGDVLAGHTNPPNAKCPFGANIQPALEIYFRDAQAALEAKLAQATIADIAADIRARAKDV